MNNPLVRTASRSAGLFLLLGASIFGLFFLASCGHEQKVEARDLKVTDLQSQVEQLQKEVSDKDSTIKGLKNQVAEIRNEAPEPHDVQPGDSHWKIAYDFLTKEKGVEPPEAKRMLADSALFDPILAGSRVWSSVEDGNYGGFLTQGSASVSPGTLMKMEKKQTEQEMSNMQSKVTELGREIDQQRQQLTLKSEAIRDLDREKAEQVETLQSQISSLQERIDGLQSEKTSLESEMNSVYYLAGTKHNLESQGKIKGTFLGLFGMKVGDISFADFQNRVDLRDKSAIELSAPDLGVKEIEKIGILPKYLKKGYDYRVEIASNKQTAKIHFLNTDKFRIARIVAYIN